MVAYPTPVSRIKWIGLLCFVTAAFVVMQVAACRNAPSASVSNSRQQAVQQIAQDRGADPAGQSCRVFVQKFYDWYWNQFADKADDASFDPRKLHVYDDALLLKPAALSQELIRLIKKDSARSKATGEIVNLDFDPFLNSQDPSGKYVVGNVEIANDVCHASIDKGHEVAELKKSGTSWLFVNFRYSHSSEDGKRKDFPDDDLLHILDR
jgi:hypothetical protein